MKYLKWKYAFILLAAIALVTMLVMSQNAAISGDEFWHTVHSEDIMKYYKDGDKTASDVMLSKNMAYYGQSPDTFAAIIYKAFGIEDIMAVRHFINAFCGWVAILFVALLAKKIAGKYSESSDKKYVAALLAMILMLLSPRFMGHSLNNLKDVPFAAGAILSLYYILMFLDDLPKIRWSTVIKLTLALAFASSVRIGGLLFIAFFGLFAVVYYVWKRKELKHCFGKTLLWSLGIVVASYIIMVFTWPYALEKPVANPKEAFFAMSKYAVTLRQVFDGKMIWSDVLPLYYTPKFILMTIPSAVIVGIIVNLVLLRKNKKQWFYHCAVLFAFIFPVFWIAITGSNVYGGWRHSMFVYPPMVVCAALGFYSLIEIIKNKYGKYAVGLGFALLCIHPLAYCIRNHPYEVVYFNELEGGIKKAYGNYELDYYFHSLKEATQWVKNNAEKKADGSKIIVGAWHVKPVEYYLRKDTAEFQTTFIRYYEKGSSDWDYAIFVTTGINPEEIKNGSYPPKKNTVYKVEVDGIPICVVLKRGDKSDYLAAEAVKNNDIPAAISLYQKALAYDNQNETAALGLAQLYLQTNNVDSALVLLNGVLKYDSKSDQTNYLKAHALLMQGKNNEALNICDNMIKNNFKNNSAYSLAADIKLRQQPPDLMAAEGYLLGLVEIERFDNTTMQRLIAIYKAYGLDERNAAVKLYSILEEHFRKKGDNKTADQYADYIRQIFGGR
ncbi:MAG: tetratricopeptide repeat protein [Bacteroidales bacterium]|jgi:4-amino-4-deoxy-L-arabinose transferase-like glycosyltransferase|nr:tetratricopeptide repeat protein [Bacteroidales bacterium]